MLKEITLKGRSIGENSGCFVIAEAGVNHNGRLDLALQLVDVAAEAGADAIKFQTFKAEQVVTSYGKMAAYQIKNLKEEKSQLDMIRELELPDEDYAPILQRCQERGILFMSTPHGGRRSVDFLETLDVEIYKISSADLTNYLLLDRVAETKKPIILSTGMATLDEVREAVNFVQSKGNDQLVVLHCTTNYPCPPEEVNLAAMLTIRDELQVLVGYSDHTLGSQVGIMAATLGACAYECHFTVDKSLPGPDHVASASREELIEKIKSIRACEVILGSRKKAPNKSEAENMISLVRKSLVAAHDLAAGVVLSLADLEAKRPGDGTSPTLYQEFIGKKLMRALKADEQLTLSDIEDK